MSILGLTCYKNMFMSILTRFLVLHSRFYFQYKNSVYFFKRNNIFSECETCARSSCITFQMLSARSQIFAWYIFCIYLMIKIHQSSLMSRFYVKQCLFCVLSECIFWFHSFLNSDENLWFNIWGVYKLSVKMRQCIEDFLHILLLGKKNYAHRFDQRI